MTGYSHTSLKEKLGLKASQSILVVMEPKDYWQLLGQLPSRVKIIEDDRSSADLIHAFASKKITVEDYFASLKPRLKPDGSMWISWPKGSSGVKTELNENAIRDLGLKAGLVDVKVVSIDNTWSGLKFVYRLKDR